ncbi:MAG: hypothetical protein R3B81_01610 [bacterium]
MTRRILGPGALLTLGLALTGCQSFDVKYEEMPLQDVLRQGIPDATHHYRIDRPRVAAARRNTALIRDGSLFLIAVGPGLRSAVNTYDGPNVDWGVRLVKEPRTHLIVDRVFTPDGEVDLFEGIDRFRFDFPDFVNGTEIPVDSFPIEDPAQLAEGGPKFVFFSDLVVRKAEAPETLAAAVPGAFEGRQPKLRFFLGESGESFLVSNADVSTLLLLDWMATEPRKFKGGVKLEQVLEPADRRATGVIGTVDVRWIDIGGLFYRARTNVTE